MKQVRVLYDEDQDARAFSNMQALDGFLNGLHTAYKPDHPIIVSFEIEGDDLSIGLGLSLSFVQVIKNDNLPPCRIAPGDNNLEGEVVFFFQGKHHPKIPRSYRIPIDQARASIREYIQTGVKSDQVSWVEV